LENKIDMKLKNFLSSKQETPVPHKRETSEKMAEAAAELMLDKLNECTIGDNLVKEIKRSIVLQGNMIDVKNKYVRDDLTDLDNKLGEQMSSLQIDHLRNHKKTIRLLTDLSIEVKENAAKQAAICNDIRRHMGSLAGSMSSFIRNNLDPEIPVPPPELSGQHTKPKMPRGRHAPFLPAQEPLHRKEQEPSPFETNEAAGSGKPPSPLWNYSRW
jgi:hypothetical protein